MFAAAAVRNDGVVVAGYSNGTWNGDVSKGLEDFVALKVDTAGTVFWECQVFQSIPNQEDPSLLGKSSSIIFLIIFPSRF